MLKSGPEKRAFAVLHRLRSRIEGVGSGVVSVRRKRDALAASMAEKRRDLIGHRDPGAKLSDLDRLQGQIEAEEQILAGMLAEVQPLMEPLSGLVDMMVLDILSWGTECMAQALDGAIRVKNALSPGSAEMPFIFIADPANPESWLIRDGRVRTADGKDAPIEGSTQRDPAIAKLTETLVAIRKVVETIRDTAAQRP